MNRIKEIIKVSFIGIFVNFILVVFKAAIGLIAGSLSIIMDALNNLSDALSSIITIASMFLAGRKPDKNHPYGYGKVEYISSLIIATIVLITGITALYESFKRILTPSVANYTPIMLFLILIGVITKFILGRYVKKQGKKLNSNSLIASGSDASFDAIISFSTLIGALISYKFGISIDGYLGLLIAIIIIKAAIEIIIDSFNDIIGTRIDPAMATKIKNSVNQFDDVLGAYDLTLHQYGPEKIIGSIHIEINDTLTAKKIHTLTRKISEVIYNKYGVILTIGIYASNTDNSKYLEIKKQIKKIIKNYPSILQFHGYYVDSETKYVSFDLIFDFKEKDVEKYKNEIIKKLINVYPDYKFNIILDNDFSD